MDSIKGALELREILEKRGTIADEQPRSSEVPDDALPVFHWLGVVPTFTDESPHL